MTDFTIGGDNDPTAQDVISAMRFVLMAQKDTAERLRLVDMLLDIAPDTLDDRGIDLVRLLLAEGSLKMAVADAS